MVASVIAVVLMLLLGSIQNSVEASQRSLERTQASYLLEEGAEAVKSIRDISWDTISEISNDTAYYLLWNGSIWTLTTTPVPVDMFSRTITFSSVSRDGNDDIVTSGGVSDPTTRQVTVEVTWIAPSEAKSETLTFFIADIR